MDNPFGGKPRSAPIRKTPVPRLRARSWDDNIDYTPLEMDEGIHSKFHIPKDIIQSIQREDGVALQWVTEKVYGQEQTTHVAQFTKNYWVPVYQNDLGGVLDGRFCPKGQDCRIEVDGMVLMARPVEVDDRARRRDRAEAASPINTKKEQLLGGNLPGVAGADHPTALRTNRINRSIETVAIPED